jgi:hypothetical protein
MISAANRPFMLYAECRYAECHYAECHSTQQTAHFYNKTIEEPATIFNLFSSDNVIKLQLRNKLECFFLASTSSG